MTVVQDSISPDDQPIELVPIATDDARRIVNDAERAEALAATAQERAGRWRGALGNTLQYVLAFARLLQRYVRRDYTAVPWKSVVLIAAALIYFVSPIDLIPDFLFGGMIDDVAVIGAVLRAVREDLDNFLAWERAEQPAQDAS